MHDSKTPLVGAPQEVREGSETHDKSQHSNRERCLIDIHSLAPLDRALVLLPGPLSRQFCEATCTVMYPLIRRSHRSNEATACHSITSLARARRESGISSPKRLRQVVSGARRPGR